MLIYVSDEALLVPILDSLFPHLLAGCDSAHAVVGEDVVDLLECQVRGLGVAEVYKRDKGEVQDHEDQVSLPCQSIQDDRRDHDNEEIPQPVGGDTDRNTLGSDVQG